MFFLSAAAAASSAALRRFYILLRVCRILYRIASVNTLAITRGHTRITCSHISALAVSLARVTRIAWLSIAHSRLHAVLRILSVPVRIHLAHEIVPIYLNFISVVTAYVGLARVYKIFNLLKCNLFYVRMSKLGMIKAGGFCRYEELGF